MELNQFHYTQLDQYAFRLQPYSQLRDYRYFFSSKEWISTYMRAYKPTVNYLFTEGNNYFVLSKIAEKLSFCGADLNDFNGMDNVDSSAKFDKAAVIAKFRELDCPIFITQLFEEDLIAHLIINARKGKLSESVAVTPDVGRSLQTLISKRIRKMYMDNLSSFSYHRYFVNDFSCNIRRVLSDMLLLRQAKLFDKHGQGANSSFSDEFIELFENLTYEDSMRNNMFIDVAYHTNKPVGMTVNFLHNRVVLNYLRCFVEVDKTISNGLMLDFWASTLNDRNNVLKVDLLRGAESYKYRLGGASYFLENFKMNEYGN